MANNHTKAHARRNGDVLLHSTTTDSPILPIEQIERLKQIAPDRVDWIFEQTTLESTSRRSERKRINTLIFVERILGLFCALMVAMLGLGAAVYCAYIGKEIAASVIGGATLVGLVSAFIVGRHNNKD